MIKFTLAFYFFFFLFKKGPWPSEFFGISPTEVIQRWLLLVSTLFEPVNLSFNKQWILLSYSVIGQFSKFLNLRRLMSLWLSQCGNVTLLSLFCSESIYLYDLIFLFSMLPAVSAPFFPCHASSLQICIADSIHEYTFVFSSWELQALCLALH